MLRFSRIRCPRFWDTARAGRAAGYLKKGPEPVGAWPGIHVECPPAVQPPNPG